mmetsp:Transcript_26/g.108  ORF Transcript_26/g.108 Transcript_26/m.108 type:complete len:232 (+) Transcript_26:1124-1819(+)
MGGIGGPRRRRGHPQGGGGRGLRPLGRILHWLQVLVQVGEQRAEHELPRRGAVDRVEGLLAPSVHEFGASVRHAPVEARAAVLRAKNVGPREGVVGLRHNGAHPRGLLSRIGPRGRGITSQHNRLRRLLLQCQCLLLCLLLCHHCLLLLPLLRCCCCRRLSLPAPGLLRLPLALLPPLLSLPRGLLLLLPLPPLLTLHLRQQRGLPRAARDLQSLPAALESQSVQLWYGGP